MDNREKAIVYFESTGELLKDRGPYDYCLHHVDESLRHTNPERYNQWNPEDLVVMTRVEHQKLHNTGKKFSEEHKKKLSESHKGIKLSEDTRQRMSDSHKGKHHSEETKRKISDSHKCENLSKETRKKLSEAHKGKTWRVIDGKRVWIDKEARKNAR